MDTLFFLAASTSLREKVNERVRARLNRDPGDEVEETDKHSLIWGIFMTSSMYAAIFVGKDYSEKLRSVRNTDHKPTVQKLFDVTQKLIREKKLEMSVSELSWEKFYMGEADPGERRKGYQALEFEWKIFPGQQYTEWILEFEWKILPDMQILREIQEFLKTLDCDPEHFQGRIIFMSMFNDISWRNKDNELVCSANALIVGLYAKRFAPGHWSFLGPGSETKWYSTKNVKPEGQWDKVAEIMKKRFQESRHPIFRATSAVDRGHLKSKGGGPLSIHFLADEPTIETIFRTIVSANQLSIHGAVVDLCEEFSDSLFCAETSYAIEKQTESMVKSADLLNIQRPLPTNEQAQGDLLHGH